MEKIIEANKVAWIIPLLFFAFTIFIPSYLIAEFEIFQRVAIVGLVTFYWFMQWLQKNTVRVSMLELGLLAFIFFQIFRSFFIEHPSVIWPYINHWLSFLLLLVVLKRFPFDEKSRAWYLAIHLSCLVYLTQISLGFFDILNSGLEGFNFVEYGKIGLYTKGNTNFLSAILALYIPFFFSFKSETRAKSIFSFLLAFCCLIFIFLLNSRGVSFYVLLLFVFLGIRHYQKITILKHVVFPIFIIGSLLFVASQIGDKDAFLKSYNPISSFDQSNSDGRLDFWQNSIKLFQEKPLLGHGVGSWKINNSKYGLSELKWSKNSFFYTEHAHSLFFELLAEAGIIGLLFFILVIVYPLLVSFRQADDLAFSLLFLISGFVMVYGFFYQSKIGLSPHLFIWVFALSRLKFKKNFVFNNWVNGIGVLLAGLSFVFLLWSISLNKQIRKINEVSNEEAITLAEKIEKLHHPIFMNYIGKTAIREELAKVYWKAGERKKSLFLGEAALKDNPHKTKINFDLGLRYKAIQNYNKAKYHLEKALAINSSNSRVKIEAAKLAMKTKDWNTYDKYVYELETMTREELERYYTDKILDGTNQSAKNYVNNQCFILDQVLKMKVAESQIRQ